MDFNYDFYLNQYEDLKIFKTEAEALQHWQKFGIHEGRVCCPKKMNFETNVTIIIHLFNENLFDEFCKYIKNVTEVFQLVNVIFTINIKSNFETTILEKDSRFIVIKVENKGTDNYQFLESVKYIRTNNVPTDFILKMHTKESTNEVENFLNWRKDLIEPITNIKNLYVLQHYFKTVKNIGCISSQKCCMPKNFDLDFPHNIKGLNQLCEKFDHLEKDWMDFNGGNIFWISNEVLDKYLTNELIDYLNNNFSHGKPPNNLYDHGIYVEYLCERLFSGIFCYDRTNILVNEFNGTNRGTDLNSPGYFYQPSVFSFSTPKMLLLN